MSKWSHAFAEADIRITPPVPIAPLAPIGRTEGAIGTNGTNGTGVEGENEADAADRDGEWAERAAITEYDGKLHRGVAEQVADACCAAPFGPEPQSWPDWFAAEIAKRAPALGSDAARRRVAGKALSLWHFHHGKRGEPGRCAGCGGYLPTSAAFTLGDGATIHSGDAFTACLIGYGAKWRPAALAGLQRLGLAVTEADL